MILQSFLLLVFPYEKVINMRLNNKTRDILCYLFILQNVDW